MKARRQILLFSFCVSTQCVCYAFVSAPTAQQSAASSAPATRNRTALPPETHQSARIQPVSGKIPLPSRASVVKANGLRMVHKNSQGLKSRSLVGDLADKAATNRKVPIQPAAVSGIGGGNFRNRRRTPIPGVVGGPAKTTRNTATLSGTGMARKGLN